MASTELTPADLVEMERIKRLKYAYLRCLDQKRWEEMRGLLTDDCVGSYSGGANHYEGADAIVAFMERTMGADTFHSSHRCHHPEIDLTGPGTATATWALEDTVIDTAWDISIRGAAFYEDTYRKVDGEWRIARTGYKRTFEEIQPRVSTEGLRLTASWWATGGVSELTG